MKHKLFKHIFRRLKQNKTLKIEDFSEHAAESTIPVDQLDTAERSHSLQDEAREPCACFPDYGRRALTPSNKLYSHY